MNQLLNKILLFSVLTFGIQIFAMEKDEPAIIKTEASRSFQLANEILQTLTEKYELKAKEIEQLKILIKRIENTFFIIKKLLDEEHFNEIETDYVNTLNAFLDEWSKETSDSVLHIICFKGILISTLEQLLLIICSNNRPAGIYKYLLQAKNIDFDDLYARTVEILLTSNDDCFDAFIVYAKEYKLNNYAVEVLSKFEQEKEFSDTFYKLVLKSSDLKDLLIFIIERWAQIIDENTLNKNVKAEAYYRIDNMTNLCVLLSFVSMRAETVQDRQVFKQILQKIIVEPTIKVETWLDALNKIRDKYEFLKKTYENDIDFLENIERLGISLAFLERTIDWKLHKIKLIRTQLFDAVKSQDIELTKKLAHNLYTITRNFENENGDTPLHIAVLTQNQDLIKALLSIYPEQMLVKNNDGETPIHIAAAANQDILEFMMNLLYKIDENSKAQQNLNK